MTMLPDNEVVIRYIEEYLHGVIPEDYREAQGRTPMISVSLDSIAAEDVYDSVVMPKEAREERKRPHRKISATPWNKRTGARLGCFVLVIVRKLQLKQLLLLW